MTLPLHGHRLIEASAGTGKTWTIAALYLRLLLGHGRTDGTAHPEPLNVDQILVVTFTEAATEELRDRVRSRIHGARQAFLKGESDDPYLEELLADLDDYPRQAEKLLAAERQMDEAAIFTIHGFCQRMLKQHAFESGTLFTSDLMEDQSELVTDTVADFWRRTMYPLSRELAELTRNIWMTPAALESDLYQWIGQSELQIDERHIPKSLNELQPFIDNVCEIKRLWLNEQDVIEHELANALKKNSKPWNRLAKMHAFAQGAALVPFFQKEVNWQHYTPEALEKACGKNKSAPDLEVFRRIQALEDKGIDLISSFRSMMLRDALNDVRSRLIERRAQLRKMSFDDLLSKLDEALEGSGGEHLAEHIRATFRVALIDEFQDTDGVQYRIFNNLYPLSDQPEKKDDTGLFLIGDPKQAIYAFRGADIFTYIQARRQMESRYTLSKNWRSAASMIQATNHIFEQARSPFIYDSDIPFQPVDFSPGSDSYGLFIDDLPQPALQVWHQNNGENAVGKGDYESEMAQATANEINRLLTLSKHGRCHTVRKSGQQPLSPRDIAILVRTGTQADKVRKALAEQNIASVYLSDRSSVFDSPEALDLSRLLAACLEPSNERYLRAAMATPLLALQAEQLDELNNDEQCWEDAVEEFTEYHELWMRRGVLPMIRTLITRRNLAENLLAEVNGERRLTDLLHIGELLATAAREKDTPHALLRWLQERMGSPDQNAKDQQLHLESEQHLVRVVTIHKSKGLEYGLVFLPFVCTWRPQEQGIYHDDNQQLIADLSAQPEAIEKADKERLAEDLRLLYVALTRSEHVCYLGVAPVKLRAGAKTTDTDLNKTALGHLLTNGDVITANDLTEALKTLEDNCPSITITPLPESCDAPYSSPEAEKPELATQTFTGSIPRDWWMTSYSALSRNAQHAAKSTPDASHEQPGFDLEVQGQAQQKTVDDVERAPYTSLFDFPRGARPGTFLHEIFERIAFENPVPEEVEAMIREQLLLNGLEEEWLPVLQSMVNSTLNAPISHDGSSFRLADLQAGSYKAELEFNLSLGILYASRLNQLLQSSTDPLASRAGDLTFQRVQGLLKGFIDLTFQHNGKWYVLDWKSNWLGDCAAAYTREAMADAMIDHRYDLQYLIYTLALHRLLKNRLPDYDYDTHIGGAIYVFLRGIPESPDSEESTGIYHHKPNKNLIENLDQLFDGKKAGEEAAPC
ncbi:exodeoxyribonuclease V subunit beta [Sansalvadorimonas verongulae]|nr:exodeoxyribonuclease V subunit beta [Sansalvadorimonas verongulae]